MSDSPRTTGPHLTDGELVRLLDGEVARSPASELEEHLRSCESCGDRYRRIEESSRDVRRTLDAADPLIRERAESDGVAGGGPVGSPARFPRWMKIAAGMVLLLTAGLAVQPVRAWMADRVEDVVERLGLGGPTPEASAGEAGSTVSFFVESSRLLVRIESPQEDGRMEVDVAPQGREVRASILSGADVSTPALVVLPSELRVRNSPGSRASYRITVPASLAELEIRVGDRRLARFTVEDLRPGEVRSWELR